MDTISFESFLYIGITFVVFRKSGQVPSRNDLLKMFASGRAIVFFIDLISWFGMLFGPTLLVTLKSAIYVNNFFLGRRGEHK